VKDKNRRVLVILAYRLLSEMAKDEGVGIGICRLEGV
jgi:hypothetical protein